MPDSAAATATGRNRDGRHGRLPARPLGVQQLVRDAQVLQHIGGDFAGVRAVLLIKHILY